MSPFWIGFFIGFIFPWLLLAAIKTFEYTFWLLVVFFKYIKQFIKGY